MKTKYLTILILIYFVNINFVNAGYLIKNGGGITLEEFLKIGGISIGIFGGMWLIGYGIVRTGFRYQIKWIIKLGESFKQAGIVLFNTIGMFVINSIMFLVLIGVIYLIFWLIGKWS